MSRAEAERLRVEAEAEGVAARQQREIAEEMRLTAQLDNIRPD